MIIRVMYYLLAQIERVAKQRAGHISIAYVLLCRHLWRYVSLLQYVTIWCNVLTYAAHAAILIM